MVDIAEAIRAFDDFMDDHGLSGALAVIVIIFIWKGHKTLGVIKDWHILCKKENAKLDQVRKNVLIDIRKRRHKIGRKNQRRE